MNLDATLMLLKHECDSAGGQKAWADKHGISPQHVNDVLWSRRDPGPAVLDALGLERVVTYVRRRPAPPLAREKEEP